MKKQKVATAVTCCALVGAIAIGGTLALLSTGPKTLKNTFTVGNAYKDTDFLLKENAVNQVFESKLGYNYGSYEQDTTEARVIEGKTDEANAPGVGYNDIVANTTLDKNPWFELKKNADVPDAWVVAKVEGVNALKTKGIEIESVGTGWQVVNTQKDGTGKITYTLGGSVTKENLTDGTYFVYMTKLDASDNSNYKTSSLFTKLHAGSVTAGITDVPLKVKGVAVQALADDTVMDNDTLQAVMEALPAGFINAK